MSTNEQFPSYQKLFDKLDFKKGDDARSVYSPGAYLADLLQLLHDKFGTPDLTQQGGSATRRPDIEQLRLNGENTFKELPYLDIVNELLEKVVGDDPYKQLREARFPMQLPFNLQNERIKRYRHHLDVSAEQIYKAFALQPDSDIVARDFLGLSEEEYPLIAAATEDLSQIKSYYRLGADDAWSLVTAVDIFLQRTQLSGSELRALLFQNLSQTAQDSQHNIEIAQAEQFFIHQGLGGRVILDESEQNLIWSAPSASIPDAWFARVNCFVRLAKKTGLDFAALDLVLRSCCNARIDASAIRTVAVLKQLSVERELPIDVLCSLFSPVNTLGLGDENAPLDLFNRVFNGRWAEIDGKYIVASNFKHPAYAAYEPLICTGDLLSPDNKAYRTRLCNALALSERDLIAIVARFRAQYAARNSTGVLSEQREIDINALSLLYRVSKLAEALDVTYAELFGVLDILEKDPSLRRYNNFDVLIDERTETFDSFHILENQDLNASLWLVQALFAVVKWMQASDFTSTELNQVLSGRAATAAEQRRLNSEKLTALDSLYQQFKPVMLTPESFASPRFNERASRVIHRVVSEKESDLVSHQDARLLRFDEDRAAAAAYQAIAQLDVIRAEDFIGLGLESRLADKIYANLIIQGVIDESGQLQESHLPKSPSDFQLASDFSEYREAVFAIINGLFAAANDDASDRAELGQDDTALADVTLEAPNWDALIVRNLASLDTASLADAALFPSDLDALTTLSALQRNELYDNLIFNGYLSAEGNVLQSEFFLLPENVADFRINAELAGVVAGVYAELQQRSNMFDQMPLVLDTAFFAELALTPTESAALIDNLRFNAHIDLNNRFIDKRALLSLTVDRFDVALEFYPRRRKILAALKTQIENFQAEIFKADPSAFSNVADNTMAQRVVESLTVDYLKSNRVSKDKLNFFLNRDNLADFSLGAVFNATDNELVFNQLATILAERQRYQLPIDLADEFYFDQYEYSELLQLLGSMGCITHGLGIAEEKLRYFLNINNALEFSLVNFEDYSKDVFFVLQAIAIETDAAMREIIAALKSQRSAQEGVVFSALQDAWGVDVELIKVLCRHVFRGTDAVVEAFVLPLLPVVDINDTVATAPVDKNFNLNYKQMAQFALLASKLGLSAVEADIVLRDQDLVEKLPEKLRLPNGVTVFDALLESPDGIIYVFRGREFWTYSAATCELLQEASRPLSQISERFANVEKINAAFVDGAGTSYLVAAGALYAKFRGATEWVKKERTWGKVKSNFDNPQRIDTAFQDHDAKTYLFVGDQYVRYSGADYASVDEGYPRSIAGNWENEGRNAQLPAQFKSSIDASFQGTDGHTYLFKQGHYVSSAELGKAADIKETWGRVRNNFAAAEHIDAAYVDGAETYLFAGNQVIAYRDSVENDRVKVKESYPKRIENHFANLPAEFEMGLEAAFKGTDGKIHLFKNGKTVSIDDGRVSSPAAIKKIWGRVANKIQETGRVDAAFVGLDGKTYLFSGNQYIRYSGSDYAQVDEGYPRVIASDWGGLRMVDAAFTLNGKTYLFGKNDAGEIVYVRYSTRDYRVVDSGYPKQPNDNWWNLPAKLLREDSPFSDLEKIDAVFTGKDNITYLFSGKQFISFDNKQRWWSEPQNIDAVWNGIPLTERVDAAFVGTDGKTYVFSGSQYVRYSNASYSRVDDRYPNAIKAYWSNVVNNIEKTGTVDAALVVESRELVDGIVQRNLHTYLFAGNQYVRYSGADYKWVESGYPRYIASSLKSEPRFKHLAAGCEKGIDAAFADTRNVYLFKDARCHVLSDAVYRVYDQLGLTGHVCALMENGVLFVEQEQTWYRYSALEGAAVEKITASPTLLRNVPEPFQRGLDAVLQGVDRNTYLFKGAQCFNVSAHTSYPLAEEWGRAKNNIYLDNSIDAAFVGVDNKTYVFSGDQFVTYTGATYEGANIAGYPKSIAASWGGLTNVALAYVRNGKTFLFEKGDADGRFRYVCYSTADYTQPDESFPQTADSGFWKIPDQYHEQGFSQIRGVLFEGDTMFLLSHDHYLQYDETTRAWSYPRPIDRIWRGFPWHEHDFPAVKTAFRVTDGTTYFFADSKYLRYTANGFSAALSIKDNWGLTRNNFAGQPGPSKVDAAFVYRNKTTYLFSGDQYVRYSGDDYRYADDGYPKALLDNLREEPCFQNLPETFENFLRERIAQMATTVVSSAEPQSVIDGVVANERNIYLFTAGRCYVVSQNLATTYDLNMIGQVKNNLVDFNRVDASFVGEPNDSGDAPTFLFSGDQYIRYSSNDYSYVDDGYPRSIGDALAAELSTAPLPARFNEGLDAALRGADGRIYLFKDSYYLQLGDGAEMEIKGKWGVIDNAFAHDQKINAAIVAANGNVYAFKERQFIRYQSIEQEFVDEAYPKYIRDQWGDLPAEFEGGIDGAFVFSGKIYFVKGENYVRYSDLDFQRIDSIYPQAFTYRWGNWADYYLSDIKTIARFKELQDTHASAEGSLAECLDANGGAITAPYELLANLFGWDVEELKWLKRHNGFLPSAELSEVHFQLELIIKLTEVFATAQKIGAKPSDLWTNVWRKLYDNQATESTQRNIDLRDAADALYRTLALAHSEQDWQRLAAQIHGELNELRRDALTARVIAQDVTLGNARDLYERYLIDVEMASSGTTSRVQEAIAAVQLYFHRYFFNLESAMPANSRDALATKQELKDWWTWMRNYRLWEANRKVFLYPENYIRPELRDTKTPAFKTLEEDLLQGDITDATVQEAYKKYLDEYTEVSRLTIAGGYVYQIPGETDNTRNLIMFGRTKTDPQRYYYRMAKLGGTRPDRWEPWLKVNVQIDAENVYPVFAFGRVFVFWTKVETIAASNTKTTLLTTNDGKGNQTVSSAARPSYAIKINFSFYNLNKEWVAPQALSMDVRAAEPISDVRLFVENSATLDDATQSSSHENIVISCTYRLGQRTTSASFNLTPELYAKNAVSRPFVNRGADVFRQIVNEPVFLFDRAFEAVDRLRQWGMFPFNVANIVQFNKLENATDGHWFSFDYKGGSFLCKPANKALPPSVWPNERANGDKELPQRPAIINAAVVGDAGETYYFSGADFVVDSGELQSSAKRWGHVRNNIAATGVVDAALQINGKIYLFSGDEYLAYSDGLGLADEGSPKSLVSNADGFPPWKRVRAAFTAADGKSYLFNPDAKTYVTMVNGVLSAEQAVQQKWGIVPAVNVNRVFVNGDFTYLVFGTQYARYKNAQYGAPEVGYPKAFSTIGDIPELSKIDNATTIDPKKLSLIFTSGQSVLFQYDGDNGRLQRFQTTPGQDFEQLDFAKRLNKGAITAATLKGDKIYVFRNAKFGNNERVDSLDVFRKGGTWEQQNVRIKDSQGKNIALDQALAGSDGKFYLFAGGKCWTSEQAWDALIQEDKINRELFIQWPFNADSIAAKWLGQRSNRIAETGIVDAAFVRGEHTYLISGNEYVRYTGTAYDAMDEGYPMAVDTNNENLPKWQAIGAALTTSDGKSYFFNHATQSYVDGAQLDVSIAVATTLGIVRNNITETGVVDTAYRQGDYLYLTSGDALVRYTLAEGAPDRFVDAGYPKAIRFNAATGIERMDAAFTLGAQAANRYYFAGNYYFRLPVGEEPLDLQDAHLIKGSWGNLPGTLQSGLDGALQRGDVLYLFKGSQYAKYDADTMPYEIVDAKYDIVRLTSSTAYKLNQELFTGGVPGLLKLATQEIDELPSFRADFSAATTIRVNAQKVGTLPESNHLDFNSANGIYYWEIFFHAPFLIAQALNTAQKFEEAKQWYEFIFDPLAKMDADATDNCWRFLPFRPSIDAGAANEKLVDSVQVDTQIKTYLDDPFDPHAIAALRTTAYRKAIVMAYVDNVLDWGDMLFRQYTRESINEARMLYILAYDLLGEKPENLGRKILSSDKSFAELPNPTEEYDILLSIDSPYFFIPENTEFGEYWTRVQDRLTKIRHSLNILGISQPLPLFEPPIDPMALVQATSSGAALSSVMAGLNVAVPHYRCKFMLRKAQELLQTVNGFGNDLLAALEKKDAENLTQLQNRQEGEIVKLTRAIKEAQVTVAAETVKELEESAQSAQDRMRHYSRLINEGLLPTEEAQIGLMAAGATSHFVSAGLKIGAAVATGVPEILMGPFIIGTSVGGQEIGGALSEVAGVAEGMGEGLSMAGEVLGVVAQFQRSTQDWDLQLNTAQHDIVQIGHQLSGARLQEQIARRELEIHDKQIAHNAAITTFMQTKFSNAQLYQWMVSKLAGLYYQSYGMAYDMAKAAEKAFQFERAVKASDVNYIQPIYWDSQKHGLLAGVSLGQDLTRLEKAYVDNDRRGFEITKKISLLALDPVALLQLKTKGVCEFALTEALFDYDFPGHYCRQIRTVAITFSAGEQRLQVNATLTQLNHKTALEPDAKAVKYLMDPKDQPPLTLRNDWRSSQQIALSHVEDNEANNGLFELRYDDDRYLPFEGTGAVSTWRLELNGKKGAYNLNDLRDVIVTLKYSAEQGGDVFATAVKGMLKPYTSARLFDVAREFADQWETFHAETGNELVLTLTRDQFPQMHGSRLTGVYTRFEMQEPGAVSMVLNNNSELTLKDGKYLPTPGLTVGRYGSEWALRVQGDKAQLLNVGLVVMYTAKVD